MKARETGKLPRIEGGLDDTSDAVRIGYKAPKAPKKTSAEKTRKSLKEVLAEPTEDLTATPETPEVTEVTETEEGVQQVQQVKQVKQVVKTPSKRLSKDASAFLVGRLDALQTVVLATASAVSDIEDTVAESAEELQGLKSMLEKAPEEPTDALAEFKKGDHRVTFVLNGMEFTVKCLNMTKDDETHSLVLAFPADGDSFFTPPMQSELRMKYDGEATGGKLFYFGMNFVLKTLGLRFLGFIFDDREEEQV